MYVYMHTEGQRLTLALGVFLNHLGPIFLRWDPSRNPLLTSYLVWLITKASQILSPLQLHNSGVTGITMPGLPCGTGH